MGLDSRSTLRYPVDLTGTMILASTTLSCRVRNVSLGGVFVLGPTLTIGTRVQLHFGADDLEIDSPCITRWNTDEGTGLQFEGLRAIDTYMLSKFIRKHSRATGRIPTDAILRPTHGFGGGSTT
jgi:hypothetical protein